MANCTSCNSDFEIRTQDREFYQRFDVPDPAMCPECRLQYKLNFRNERTMYKRTSSLSGQVIVSIYAEDSKHKVYSQEEWWSDKWDATDFGQEFDFNRPFFDQFQELLLKVPRIALFNVNPTNSDFCQQAYNNKDCYMCVVVKDCQDSMYITHSNSIQDGFDSSFIHTSELCYECLDSEKLYNCAFSQSCQNSSDLIFSYDCIGCKDCAGCYGLRNKQYHIMNQPYSREEYFEKLKNLELNKYSKFMGAKDYFAQLAKKSPHRASRNLNVDNCTGNYLINCKDCYHCYDSFALQDCAYSTWIFNSHDCYDVYGMGYGEFVYEGLGVEKLNNCAFNTFVSDSNDVFYSDCSFYSNNLFGCAGVRNKKYCILNKQYSQEDYEAMVPKIIAHMKATGEWGKFFPVALSPFAYNETAASYRFPLSKEQILSKGYRFREPDKKEYLPQNYVLPDDTREITESILNEILACRDCGKNYKIMANELRFYKKSNLPVPRTCLDCRFLARFATRNPRKIWQRNCAKCSKAMETTYSPDRPETVLCEQCYALEIN